MWFTVFIGVPERSGSSPDWEESSKDGRSGVSRWKRLAEGMKANRAELLHKQCPNWRDRGPTQALTLITAREMLQVTFVHRIAV